MTNLTIEITLENGEAKVLKMISSLNQHFIRSMNQHFIRSIESFLDHLAGKF